MGFIVYVSGSTYYAYNEATGATDSDTNFYNLINTKIMPKLEASGDASRIYIRKGDYLLDTALDFTPILNSKKAFIIEGESARDPYSTGTSGFGVRIWGNSTLDHLIKFTQCDGCELRNLYFYGNNKVQDGIVIEDTAYWRMTNVSIDSVVRRGLYLHGASANASAGTAIKLLINMPNNVSPIYANPRGIVFRGDSPYAATHNHFYDMRVVLSGTDGTNVLSSIALDFEQYSDNNWIYGLRVKESNSSYVLDTGIGLGTGGIGTGLPDYSVYRGVRNNHVFVYTHEQRAKPIVIAGIADDDGRMQNTIYNITYPGSFFRGRKQDLHIVEYGQQVSFYTNFESIDSYIQTILPQPGSSAQLVFDGIDGTLTFKTGTTANSSIQLAKNFVPDNRWSWLRIRRLRLVVKFSSNTNQEIYMIVGNTGTSNHFGFKVVNNKVYGSNGNNGSESLSNPLVDPIDITKEYVLEACQVGNTGTAFKGVYYWGYEKDVNSNISVKELTGSAPVSNSPSEGKLLNIYIKNTAAEDKQLKVGYWESDQYS